MGTEASALQRGATRVVVVVGLLSLVATLWSSGTGFVNLWRVETRASYRAQEHQIIACLDRELPAATRPGQTVAFIVAPDEAHALLLTQRASEILYPRVRIVSEGAEIELVISEAPPPRGCTVRVRRDSR